MSAALKEGSSQQRSNDSTAEQTEDGKEDGSYSQQLAHLQDSSD